MKKYFVKKGIFAGIYMAVALIIELIVFQYMRFGLFPKYFAFDLAFIMFFAIIIFVIPSTTLSIVFASLLMLGQTIVSVVNINLYLIDGSIFTTDLLDFAGEAGAVMDFFNFNVLFLVLLIPYGGIMLMLVTALRVRDKYQTYRKNALMLASMLLFAFVATPTIYTVTESLLYVDTVSDNLLRADDRGLFNEMSVKTSFLKKFGTYPLYFKNVLLGQSVGRDTSVTNEQLRDYLQAGQQNRVTTGQYWGIDQGNNLVVVMLESMDYFLIHPKYTPTLYNLSQQGLSLDNYYTQNKTDYSEANVILGSYPSQLNIVSPFFTGVDWSNNTTNPNLNGQFDFSLPNMLKANGYGATSYFHPNWGRYYSRQYTHTKYGFDNAYFLEDYMTNPNYVDYVDYVNDYWAMPEELFMDAAIDQLLPITSQPFFSFFTTINAHGSYHVPYGNRATANLQVIDDADFVDIATQSHYQLYKNALAEAMLVDQGIEYLMQQISVRGLADNTTILFFTDHYCYSDDLAYKLKQSTVTESASFHIPAFLYSPSTELQNMQVDKFMTVVDLTTMLFEILGIEYNPAMYLGRPFSTEEQGVVISRINGAVFNDLFYTLDAIEQTYVAPQATSDDFRQFQQRYLDLVEKWSFVDGMYTDKNIILADYL